MLSHQYKQLHMIKHLKCNQTKFLFLMNCVMLFSVRSFLMIVPISIFIRHLRKVYHRCASIIAADYQKNNYQFIVKLIKRCLISKRKNTADIPSAVFFLSDLAFSNYPVRFCRCKADGFF